jgi:hypothetical protein
MRPYWAEILYLKGSISTAAALNERVETYKEIGVK